MESITYDNAHKIKDILLNNYLEDKSINLEFEHINTKVIIDGLTKSEKSSVFTDRDMDMRSFFNSRDEEDKDTCVNINNKKELLYLNIGQWGDYKYDIENMHLVLGTTTSKFGSAREYFSQIELSQSLEDEEYIYIVKNISDLAGRGAISRINTGLKSYKDKKHERRTRLVKSLNSKVISHSNKDWMVVSQVAKDSLSNEKNYNEVFYELINDIINYSFTVEDIIAEDKI